MTYEYRTHIEISLFETNSEIKDVRNKVVLDYTTSKI